MSESYNNFTVFDRHGALEMFSGWGEMSRWECKTCKAIVQIVDYEDAFKIQSKGKTKKFWIEGYDK